MEQIWTDDLFAANYDPALSAEALKQLYVDWAARFAPSAPRPAVAAPAVGTRRLRVGYVSQDLRGHSIRHFIRPLVANHDRNRVESFAYSATTEPRRGNGEAAREFRELARRFGCRRCPACGRDPRRRDRRARRSGRPYGRDAPEGFRAASRTRAGHVARLWWDDWRRGDRLVSRRRADAAVGGRSRSRRGGLASAARVLCLRSAGRNARSRPAAGAQGRADHVRQFLAPRARQRQAHRGMGEDSRAGSGLASVPERAPVRRFRRAHAHGWRASRPMA